MVKQKTVDQASALQARAPDAPPGFFELGLCHTPAQLEAFLQQLKNWLTTQLQDNGPRMSWVFEHQYFLRRYIGRETSRAEFNEIAKTQLGIDVDFEDWLSLNGEALFLSISFASALRLIYTSNRSERPMPDGATAPIGEAPALSPQSSDWETEMEKNVPKSEVIDVTLPPDEKYLLGRPPKGIRQRRKVAVHRLQLVLSKNDLQRLESLRQSSQTAAAADVIRRALKLYEIVLSAAKGGKNVLFEDPSNPKRRERLKL